MKSLYIEKKCVLDSLFIDRHSSPFSHVYLLCYLCLKVTYRPMGPGVYIYLLSVVLCYFVHMSL